ncbi:MAG: Rne/Rng family ribonuclease, partial [Deltaproteobacteria bacterium]
MTKEMIINSSIPENIRAAIVVEGRLHQYFEESQDIHRTKGNVYLGRVASVRPSLDACFVDYGEKKHGLLPVGNVVEHFRLSKQGKHIQEVVRPGMNLIVQVEKEPEAAKGARLTTNVSIAGRLLVLMPYSSTVGVSKKVKDEKLRKQARQLVESLPHPKSVGLIVRTVGVGETKRMLLRDMNYLTRLWKEITRRAHQNSRPCLLYAEPDMVTRMLRDYFDTDVEKVWIDQQWALENARRFFKLYAPRHMARLKLYEGAVPIFSHFDLERQIDQIYQRSVELLSGGSIVIEPTEALVSIDVNSGRMSEKSDLEQTAFQTNLEAADEIARQLRLRNLGGIIVIDFIDMEKASHRREVERRLRMAMSRDRARHRVGPISKFGLCTVTRQRLELPLRLIGFQKCSCCEGTGLQRSGESAAARLLREMDKALAEGNLSKMIVNAGTELANRLNNQFRKRLVEMEITKGVSIRIEADAALAADEFRISTERLPEEQRAFEEGAETPRRDDVEEQPNGNTSFDAQHRRKKRR